MHYIMLFMPSKFNKNPIRLAPVMAIFVNGVNIKLMEEEKLRQVKNVCISKTAV